MIDVSRLSRDYEKYPLHITKNGVGSEYPCKEDLEYLFIELNMSYKELSEYFNIDVQVLRRRLKKYGIRKDKTLIRQNIEKTMLKEYGVKSLLQSDDYRKHMESVCMERYGTKYYSQTNEYNKKVKQTKLEKYGDENYINREKTKKTNLEKYGCEYSFQSGVVRQKIKQTNKERYGCENHARCNLDKDIISILEDPIKLKSFIENQPDRSYAGLSKIFGMTVANTRKNIVKQGFEHLIPLQYNESSYEKELQKLYPFLTKHNRNLLNGSEIDLFYDKLKIGIEFNGDYWHNEYGKDKFYHQQKSQLAESKGIFIYHIFEYEWNAKKDKIINQLNNLLGLNQEKIYARKCVIKEVPNDLKKNFLEMNHLQGNDSSSIKLGLYYKDELVSLMTFCKPRFNKNYEYELSRFCSKANCNVIGGASKLWNYFIKAYNPKSVISYSNIAHTRGNLYGNLGFTLQGISEPNYVWSNGNTVLTRYQCQKHKLLEQGFEGDSEVTIMHNRGFYRIYDCGNKVWVWKK